MFSPEANAVRRGLTGVVLCLGAGALTYHLAGWYGTDDAVTLAVAVILAELFLGACIFLGLFITTRLSDTLMLGPVHEVAPQGAPTVWAPKQPAQLTPTDRKLQLYLRRVMYECDSSKSTRATDRKRALNDAPLPALKRA
jgi:hypothetical protein